MCAWDANYSAVAYSQCGYTKLHQFGGRLTMGGEGASFIGPINIALPLSFSGSKHYGVGEEDGEIKIGACGFCMSLINSWFVGSYAFDLLTPLK